LVAMAIPATKTMLELDDVQNSDMSIKVTGRQWYWDYEYLGTGVHFESHLDAASEKAHRDGSDPHSVPHYLLSVDRPLVVPVGKKNSFRFHIS